MMIAMMQSTPSPLRGSGAARRDKSLRRSDLSREGHGSGWIKGGGGSTRIFGIPQRLDVSLTKSIRLAIAAVVFGLAQLVPIAPAFAEVREVVIVGTFRTPAGQLEDVVYETNAEFFGCRQALPGLRIKMQMQVQGYEETAGWMLESARCAYQTKAGAIEEFGT